MAEGVLDQGSASTPAMARKRGRIVMEDDSGGGGGGGGGDGNWASFHPDLMAVEGFEQAIRPLLPGISRLRKTADVSDWEGFSTLSSFITEAVDRWASSPEQCTDVPDIMAAFKAKVEEMGEEVFATWVEAGDRETEHYTFKQTWEVAGAVAHSLIHKWGAVPGDRVILCYNFSYQYLFAFLGCLRAGCIACPVYPIDPSKLEIALNKFRAVAMDTGATLCLTDKLINRVRIAAGLLYRGVIPKHLEWQTTDHLVSERGLSYDYADRQPSDIAFLQYTSGSTGDPKGVMITYANLAANVSLIAGAQRRVFRYMEHLPNHQHFELQAITRSRSVCWLPMYHDMGLVYGVLTQFYQGSRMYYMSPITFLRDPCTWMRLLAKYNCHWSVSPDFGYRLCAKKWDATKWTPQEYRFDSMMYCHNGAEPIRPSTIEDFNRVFHPHGLNRLALAPCYGLAESVVCVSWFDTFKRPDSGLWSTTYPGYICVGADLKVDIRIVDPETREEVDDGTPGELWVSSPSVAAGYWGKPEVSEENFRAKLTKGRPRAWAKYGNGAYLRTGDMAFMEDDRVYFFGRIKDMIIVRGSNFYAQDVEFPAQEAWTDIRAGCIAAFSVVVDEGNSTNKEEEGEQLALVFELAPGKYPRDLLEYKFKEVAEAVTKATGLVPWRLVAVKDRTIPKTTSGKIRRRATRDALALGDLTVIHDSLGILKPGKPPKSRLSKATTAGPPSDTTTTTAVPSSPSSSSGLLSSLYGFMSGVMYSLVPVGDILDLYGETTTEEQQPDDDAPSSQVVQKQAQEEQHTREPAHVLTTKPELHSRRLTAQDIRENSPPIMYSEESVEDTASSSGDTSEGPEDESSTVAPSTSSPSSSSRSRDDDANISEEPSQDGGSMEHGTTTLHLDGLGSREDLCKLSCRHRVALLVDLIVRLCRSVGVTEEGLSGETDIMRLGLNSVTTAQMMSQLESRFGSTGTLTEVVLYECATLQDVAELLNRVYLSDSDDGGSNSKSVGQRLRLMALSMASAVASLIAITMGVAMVGAVLATSFVVPFLLLLVCPNLTAAAFALPVAYQLHVLFLMAAVTTTKWAVIGRYKPGVYSVHSLYYLRWLVVDALYRFTVRLVVTPIRGTLLHYVWLRSLGLRPSSGVSSRIDAEDVSEFDLISIGTDVIIEQGTRVRGAVVEDGRLVLAEVTIGARAVIGAQCCIQPGAVIGESVVVSPCSVVSGRSPALPDCTAWEGSPVKQVPSQHHVVAEAAAARRDADSAFSGADRGGLRSWWRGPGAFVIDLLVPMVGTVGAGMCSVLACGPALLIVTHGLAPFQGQWLAVAIGIPLIAVFGPLVLPFLAVLLRLTPSTVLVPPSSTTTGIISHTDVIVAAGVAYCLYGVSLVAITAVVQRVTGMILHATPPTHVLPIIRETSSAAWASVWHRRLAEYRNVLVTVLHARFPMMLSGTKAYAMYLQALGGKVHQEAFVMSDTGLRDPELLRIGRGAYVDPQAVLLTTTAGDHTGSSPPRGVITIGRGSVVAALSCMAPESSLQEDATLAPLTSVPSGHVVLTDTNKCGYAALLRLRHKTKVEMGRSSALARNVGAVFSWVYPLLAAIAMIIILCGASYPSFLILLRAGGYHYGSSPLAIIAIILFPAFGASLLLSGIIVKKVVLGTASLSRHRLGGVYYYRYLFVSVYLRLVDRLFACLLHGTSVYNAYLRMLGVSVGRGAIVLTSSIEAHDLISLGEATVVNRDVNLSGVKLVACEEGHHRLALDFSPVSIGHECTLGDMTVALASAEMKDFSITASGTLLTPEIMVGRRVMVEGNLPYRVNRSYQTLNLLVPSGPFNAPAHLLSQDTDLGQDCSFYKSLDDTRERLVEEEDNTDTGSLAQGGSDSSVVFITGANGFVGRHLVYELLSRGDSIVYCLVRGRLTETSEERMLKALRHFPLTAAMGRNLRVIDGDVAKPHMGMKSRRLYDWLAEQVTVVFHSATILGFAAPYEYLREANVVGTKNALSFASHRRIKRFNHVSSILAVSLDMTNPRGRVTEISPLGDATTFPVLGASEWTHGYGISKWSQEVLVRQAASAGLPTTITRLGEVGPHSETGFMEGGVLVDLFDDTVHTGVVPDVLGTINVTPVDYCARGILRVGMSEWGIGRTYHLLDPRFECGSDMVVRLLQDMGLRMKSVDFLTWRRRMKQAADVKKSWFIAGAVSGEQQLVGQNFDCTEGAAILLAQEKADIDGALLLRRFLQHKGLRQAQEI